MAEHKKKEIKVAKSTFYQMLSVALAILLIISVGINFMGKGSIIGVSSVGANNAGTKVVDFINTNLVQPGGEQATLVNATEEGGIYKITTAYKGQDISVYTSKDGKLLFISAIEMDQVKPSAQQQTEIPKTDNPTVQLFVMSFCPYGIQAEKTMKPVVDLLGSKISIIPHFIVSVDGDKVSSLHGDVEVQEDMRQACIIREYGLSTFWNYAYKFDNNCTLDDANTCWKTIAGQVSIDTAKIESCVTTDGVNLMKAEANLTESMGVSGSPTLIINDVQYNGDRTSDAYKTGICSAFTTAPTECSQNLGNSSAAASGNC